MHFRLHVVGLPHTSVTASFTACAFTQRVRKFCAMMHGLGHEVFLYAGPESNARACEHIPCISETERQAAVGDGHFIAASFDNSLPHWRSFNERAAAEIARRKQPRDFLCLIGGRAHKPVADALPDLLAVEFSVGYGGTFAPFRVFESYAWMHMCYGAASGGDPCAVDGRWFDAVIPGSFDAEDFPFESVKDGYHLFIGRLTDRKGWRVAQEACERLGKRLILAGPGEPPHGAEYVGVVGPKRRGELMAGATAVWVPTVYVEPFGNVAVEAQMCGTPVIATDWGAMTETVEHGRTGFRCRTLVEFMAAAELAGELDPWHIRERALKRYATPVIAELYQRHFERLAQLWDEGWYAV